jgi:hypothetical protein
MTHGPWIGLGLDGVSLPPNNARISGWGKYLWGTLRAAPSSKLQHMFPVSSSPRRRPVVI